MIRKENKKEFIFKDRCSRMSQLLTINPQMATIYYVAKSLSVLHHMSMEQATQIANNSVDTVKVSEPGKGENIDVQA